jgi:hypothetical protein
MYDTQIDALQYWQVERYILFLIFPLPHLGQGLVFALSSQSICTCVFFCVIVLSLDGCSRPLTYKKRFGFRLL